jgi:hypothetical protein
MGTAPTKYRAGKPRTGGRQKGTPNKTTARARHALSLAVEENADKIGVWLTEVYEKDGPRAAIDAYTKLAEFVIPKLARTELTGENGGALHMEHSLDTSGMSDATIAELMAAKPAA